MEFALILPVLAFLIIGAIDLGRMASFQNRLENAAREGAFVAQFTPGAVGSGCQGIRNVRDRAAGQNADIAANPGFHVITEYKLTGTSTFVAYSGCNSAASKLIKAGDRVKVTVKASVKPIGPVTSSFLGDTVNLSESVEVVVQG